MHSPTVAFHSSQVGSLSFNGGKNSFFANHWHFLVFVLSDILLPFLLPPPHQHLNSKAFRIFASVSNLMGTFARRCLLSYQPRNVLSKQNKSNRSLPILLQWLESHGNIISIFKRIREMSDRNTSDVVQESVYIIWEMLPLSQEINQCSYGIRKKTFSVFVFINAMLMIQPVF